MFYCRDIFDGLDKMDHIMTDKAGLLSEWPPPPLKLAKPAAARGPVRGAQFGEAGPAAACKTRRANHTRRL